MRAALDFLGFTLKVAALVAVYAVVASVGSNILDSEPLAAGLGVVCATTPMLIAIEKAVGA